MNVFPPTQMYEPPRYGTSPSSFQTGNLARALTSTAIKLIGTSANAATNAIVKAAASKRRPTIIRSGASINPAEDELLKSVEDVARKAFVLFELGDQRLVSWNQLATSQSSGLGGHSPRRKSSSSSINSEVVTLRQQEILAGEAVVLFCKAVAFIAKGTNDIKRYWDNRQSAEHEASQELNESES
jgi:serine/threonine-protein kinase ULK/ATG1